MKLKKRILVGVLCLSILLGVGSVFASRNAGEQLWTWYKKKFDIAANSITKMLEKNVIEILPGIHKEIEARKDLSVKTIAEEREKRTGMGKEKIIGVAEGYIKDIKDAQAGIEKEMPNHFKDHVNKLDADMQPRVDAKGQEALAEITKLVSNEGEIGREQITKDLRDVRDGSVKELEEAIRKAKKELEDLIIEETNASNRATKENLNKQIDAKKIEINELVREQEVFQMKSIAIVGRDLQEEAIRDLDKIIEDYFK